jgi:hypothetical protein
MHAVLVRVTIDDLDASLEAPGSQVVPRISGLPGFQAGYWTRSANTGVSLVVFESEDAAKAAADQVRSMAPPDVTVEDVEVREVVAHA